MLTLDEFAVRHVFNRIKTDDGPVYWAELDDAYLLVWPDGETLHSYHHPHNTFFGRGVPWPWED